MRCRGDYRAFCLLILSPLAFGCRQGFDETRGQTGQANAIESDAHQQLSSEGEAALNGYLDAAELPDLQHPNFQDYSREARELYGSDTGRLAWVQDRHPSPQSQALVALFKLAEEEGLNPIDYDGPRWDDRLRAIDSGRASESELVQFDLAVTISAMRYISDLHRGRVNPREFHFDLDLGDKSINLSEFLWQRLVGADDINGLMRTVEPPFPAYRQTLDALKTYRKLASEDEGELLPLPLRPVKPGDSYSGIPRLRRFLGLLGDLQETTVAVAPDLVYTEPLITAVRRFQQRHGLEPNGVIDIETVKELNVPLSQRVIQLELTLERWRWLPHEFDRSPIVVNIPEFRLYVVNGEYRPTFSMKVVVGRHYKHQTPVFATELKSVIFRPYWNVPLDIQRGELLPELRKNPSYLQEHSYEVVDRNGVVVSDSDVGEETGRQLYSGKLAIRQRPGQDNALGRVKFDMPNGYDVYMHGTPATQLFSRSRRDFSHGCIRVENPVALAEWVLRDQPGWDATHILDAMNGGQTLRVALSKPIPVLILYGTAIVTDDGEIHFLEDIYGLDAELEKALAKGYPYSGDQRD